MEHEKAQNARAVTPVSEEVAAEMRMIMAQHKVSAAKLSRETTLAKSTLHKTLRSARPVDIEDLYVFCEYFNIPISKVVEPAVLRAKRKLAAPEEEWVLAARRASKQEQQLLDEYNSYDG